MNLTASGAVLAEIPDLRDLPCGKREEKRLVAQERLRLRKAAAAGDELAKADSKKSDAQLLSDDTVGLGKSVVVQANVYKPLPSEELERITGGQIVDAHGE